MDYQFPAFNAEQSQEWPHLSPSNPLAEQD
ncbi:hypothetical protein JOE32_003283 [Pseudomonas sp. PvP025]|nr:hypothetical protein [Pseudomonas sp. PvP025]MDQ0400676.1 hypothetical protein [Pseudomonas sp. PvP006]